MSWVDTRGPNITAHMTMVADNSAANWLQVHEWFVIWGDRQVESCDGIGLEGHAEERTILYLTVFIPTGKLVHTFKSNLQQCNTPLYQHVNYNTNICVVSSGAKRMWGNDTGINTVKIGIEEMCKSTRCVPKGVYMVKIGIEEM